MPKIWHLFTYNHTILHAYNDPQNATSIYTIHVNKTIHNFNIYPIIFQLTMQLTITHTMYTIHIHQVL